jgi:hypothetical protein
VYFHTLHLAFPCRPKNWLTAVRSMDYGFAVLPPPCPFIADHAAALRPAKRRRASPRAGTPTRPAPPPWARIFPPLPSSHPIPSPNSNWQHREHWERCEVPVHVHVQLLPYTVRSTRPCTVRYRKLLLYAVLYDRRLHVKSPFRRLLIRHCARPAAPLLPFL